MPNWNDVLGEIGQFGTAHPDQARQAVDVIRRQYLASLHQYTGRNTIAYYSGFLSKPGIFESEINDEDKNGFMMAVHQLVRSKGLDLILHTQGGSISATQSIVNYLRKMFGSDIRAVVPQIAMSAGTMLACSCRQILMGTHSNLGPIDPHLRGIPAYGVLEEFKRACREVKTDPSKALIWQAIIGQYRPTFLSQCANGIKWSNSFVRNQLETVMFEKDPNGKIKAKRVVKQLTDYRGNKAHDRHIHVEECEQMGLDVERIEKDPKLQDLFLTVHHCYMHSLMNTPSFKIIENHLGSAFVKQQVTVAVRQG